MGEERLEIVIEDVGKLFKQFLNPGTKISGIRDGIYQREYELARAKLVSPVKEILIQGASDGKKYQLRAVISPLNEFKSQANIKRNKLEVHRKKIAKNFNLSVVNRAVFVLDNKGEEEFAICSSGFPLELVEITVGPRFEVFGGYSTPAKVLSDLGAFKRDLVKFTKVVEIVLQGIYEKCHQEPPRVKLFIKPDPSLFKEVFDKKHLLPALVTKEPPKNDMIVAEENKISFEDIGGQKKGKKEIQGISFALKNPDLYRSWGTKPPKGVLLFGPPGTGKTLMAKALATEANASFYNIKVADITSKWYGESEKKMQAVFDLAKKNGPSIIFLDEIDAIASERDFSHEATRRVVSTLLQNLDGIESAENIIVIASTNRLDAVDPAIKRPGRIDRLVEVPLPDEEGREHVLRIHLAKAEKIARRHLFENVDVDKIVDLTKGMSGADLAEIIRRTLEEKVRKVGSGENPTLVVTNDITTEIDEYERIRKVKKAIGFYGVTKKNAKIIQTN